MFILPPPTYSLNVLCTKFMYSMKFTGADSGAVCTVQCAVCSVLHETGKELTI